MTVQLYHKAKTMFSNFYFVNNEKSHYICSMPNHVSIHYNLQFKKKIKNENFKIGLSKLNKSHKNYQNITSYKQDII